jgi:hypothetical protein
VRPRVIAVLLATLVAMAGCTTTVSGIAAPDPAASSAAAPAPAQVGGFSDARNRFRIAPPAGWTADTGGGQGTAVVFRNPTPTRTGDLSFSANINVIVVPATADLDATIVGARQELSGLPGYASTDDEAVVLSDGTPAHLLGGTFTDARSGAQLRNLQMFAVRGGSGVVATGTAPATSWASFATPFDAALRTLTVGE